MSEVSSERICERLRELVRAITKYGRGDEFRSQFSMSIPAEPDRDADMILSAAADRIESLAEQLTLAQKERDAWQQAAKDLEDANP